MSVHTGVLTQGFKIRLNVEDLENLILDSIQKVIESDGFITDVEMESSFEEHELEVTGSYDTTYKSWHFSETRESPEEFDIERSYISDYEARLLDTLPEALKKYISIQEIQETDGMIEGEDEW